MENVKNPLWESLLKDVQRSVRCIYGRFEAVELRDGEERTLDLRSKNAVNMLIQIEKKSGWTRCVSSTKNR